MTASGRLPLCNLFLELIPVRVCSGLSVEKDFDFFFPSILKD